jgi:hypothetical protein
VRVTGFVELEPNQCDDQHSSGMTIEAYDELFGYDSGLRIADLEDLQITRDDA